MTDNRFRDAILRAGCYARPVGGEDVFAASIQSESASGDGHNPTGTGYLKRYTLYAEVNKVSQSLTDGGKIECLGMRYILERVETVCFGGKPAYRKAIVIMEEDEPWKA